MLASVVLIFLEFSLASRSNASQELLRRVTYINYVINYVWIVELTLRFLAASSKRRFFRTYWIDILAVLPLFRVFRAARLLRVLRLFGVASRLVSQLPQIFRQNRQAQHRGHHRVFPGASAEDSVWFSVYSVFAGEPIPQPPHTLGGRLTAVAIMFMGLVIFANTE